MESMQLPKGPPCVPIFWGGGRGGGLFKNRGDTYGRSFDVALVDVRQTTRASGAAPSGLGILTMLELAGVTWSDQGNGGVERA